LETIGKVPEYLFLLVERQRPRANFINLLRAAFACTDLKNAKKTVKLSVFFALLGSAHTKAACRTLMELTLARG